MATFSDGSDNAENMEPAGLQPSIPGVPANGNLRIQLQALLDDKEKQLRLAGTLGQRFLAQQMELEERISQLNELEAAKTGVTDDEAVEGEIRDKLQELKDTMSSWESENQDMFGVLGNKVNGVPPSPPAIVTPLDAEDTSVVASPTSGPSAAQSSRRAKNAAHRANDVEFAFEIGSSLLTEVRRLQSLLGERDKAIQDMKEEKDDLAKLVEDLTTGLRTQEASADKYKEENWNLEVTLQELRTQLQDAQTAGQNSEAERKRAAKQLLTARDSIDQHKNEAERLTTKLAEFKAKHETDVAQMRKQAAGLQRDKSDLQSALEALKSDIAKKDRSIKRFGSPLTPNGLSPYTTPAQGEGDEEEDVFGVTGGASNRRKLDVSAAFGQDGLGSDFADSSPDPSPSRPHLAPNHPSNEIEALKQNLAHAQRQVNMLRGTVQREKELRMEYRRKLAEAEGKAEEFVDVDDEEEENVDPTKVRARITRGRGRGAVRRGRGARSTLSQRLDIAPGTPESDFFDDTEVQDVTSHPTLQQVEQDTKDQEDYAFIENEDDGVSHVPDRPLGADGLDPAYADVTRSSPSSPAPLHGSSPLREMTSAPSRGGRRSRGGAPHLADQRPSSLVEPAGALAEELGITEPVLGPELTLTRHVETAEFACQTEPEVIPAPVPTPVPAPYEAPETREMAVQAEEMVPQVLTSEAGLQVTPSYIDAATDASVTVTSEAQVQTPPAAYTVEMDTRTTSVRTNDPDPTMTTTIGGITRRGTIIAGRPSRRGTGTDDDEEATETDTGTETEGEYTDAREYPPAITPITGSTADFYSTHSGVQESTADFHSMHTGPQESTSDFYSVRSARLESDADDSDQESIKASRLHRSRTTSRNTGVGIALGYASYQIGMHHPTQPLVPRVMSEEAVQVELKMPELKDSSIQTDDWTPQPVQTPTPASYGLFRVGSHTQQFQYIAPPTSAPSSPASSSPQADSSRDSASTVTAAAPRRNGTTSLISHDQRPSIEAALAGEEAVRTRAQSTQALLTPLDKTRPPTMILPPPPRMPPPPTIPDKKTSTGSSRDMPPPRDIPPPRPTSPPPPELIQRATTPTFGGPGLLVPSRGQIRQHGASMPPQPGLGRRPSTNSFRSAANAAAYASVSGATGISTIEAVRRQQSTTSLVSSRQSSLASHRSSVSSEHHARPPPGPPRPVPTSPARMLHGVEGGTTDPAIIHAITQTMIGEFLHKYTRRVVGKGHGEKRHKRFFWVHPYTKTLYWSSADPGSSSVSESSAKSAYIESVRSVLDPNPMPPGLYQYSVVVSTPQREMKITAPTKERHDIWFNALNYLLARPNTGPANSPQAVRLNANQGGTVPYGSMRGPVEEGNRKDILASPRSARSIGSALSGDSWNITPRAQRSQSRLSANGSVGKRSGTPAAEYLRLGGPDGPASPSKSEYEYVPGRKDDGDLDFEIHDSIMNGEGFEGLENVRACCDGRHDLGTLSRKPHHHHHHHHHHHPPHPSTVSQNPNLEPNEPASRPVSPSAWSFRSRAGSTTSHGGDNASIWSRFGSKRSKGAPPVPTSPGGER